MKYYFEHIKDGQIGEGHTVINIVNHEAEIANDDPDSVLVARKNSGVPIERSKLDERFRLSSQPPYGFFWLTDITALESLSKSDIGERFFEIGIFLDRDTLADVIYDHLPRIPRGYLYVQRVHQPASFHLSCERWGFLGKLQLSKRDNATILRLDDVPFPSTDELFPVKMVGERDLFRYGKQKYRGEVIRRFFNSLRHDPIWQDKSSVEIAVSELAEHKRHLSTLLEQHKRNLRKLRERQAKYGIEPPLSLLNEIEHEESEIVKIEAELQLLQRPA